MLTRFYSAMGSAPAGDGTLVMMADELVAATSPDLILDALHRCARECKFPVRLPDIFARIPGLDVGDNSAKRIAWDQAVDFARNWIAVGNETLTILEHRLKCENAIDRNCAHCKGSGFEPIEGSTRVRFCRCRGAREITAPELPLRILDAVRRSGGWSAFVRMTDEDFPFLQKRFFEEYEAWTAVEYLAGGSRNQLAGDRVNVDGIVKQLGEAKAIEDGRR